jgi:hypothetical protein
MYPQWINDIFEKLRCTNCSAYIKTKHIHGITTEYNPASPFSKLPRAKINANCPRCNTTHQVVQSLPLDIILTAIKAHCTKDFEPPKEEEPFDAPPPPSDPGGCDGQSLCSDCEEPCLPRFDRRQMHPFPISDSEVAAFMRLLERTSFRRDTKSFKRFMSRLEEKK